MRLINVCYWVLCYLLRFLCISLLLALSLLPLQFPLLIFLFTISFIILFNFYLFEVLLENWPMPKNIGMFIVRESWFSLFAFLKLNIIFNSYLSCDLHPVFKALLWSTDWGIYFVALSLINWNFSIIGLWFHEFWVFIHSTLGLYSKFLHHALKSL